MAGLDLTAIDHVLATTRSVRKRLDFDRPVEPTVIEECLRLAIQAPTGGNTQGWRWIVVTDAEKRSALAELYREIATPYLKAGLGEPGSISAQQERVVDSATYLSERLHDVPVHVIPCLYGELDALPNFAAAGSYGSIFPAVWSFQLALRSRGLGSVLTTLHLPLADRAAELLDIPSGVTQVGLIPVAYFTGSDFKPAVRRPMEEVTYWNGWKQSR
ncbi:MAG: nitroreductase family protein [Acidimicrobiia bacterium]|nr:nitroreductase family protein [Acidimicrobiia bacterium]